MVIEVLFFDFPQSLRVSRITSIVIAPGTADFDRTVRFGCILRLKVFTMR